MNISFIHLSGVHHRKTKCDTNDAVEKVQAILDQANAFLYPKNLIVTSVQDLTTVHKGKISCYY